MPKYEGAAAEQEEYLEQSTRAHVGAILYVDKKMHLYFSKDLLAYADPDFIPSPPASPAWKRQQPKRAARKKPAELSPHLESDAESEPPINESRNLEDMAAFWDDDDDQ